jgi:hypothetical protein
MPHAAISLLESLCLSGCGPLAAAAGKLSSLPPPLLAEQTCH